MIEGKLDHQRGREFKGLSHTQRRPHIYIKYIQADFNFERSGIDGCEVNACRGESSQ